MTKRRYSDLPPHVRDIRGLRFGRLRVVGFDRIEPRGCGGSKTYWRCHCECGNEVVVQRHHLNTGHTKSCGCYAIERRREYHTTHGKSRTRAHICWLGIRGRCYNPNNTCYGRYGGRGITVCERWRDSFDAFYEDMGDPPSKRHSLERIDNDGPYSPENCRWATPREQTRNKRSNIWLTLNGETLCVADWSRRLGIKRTTILARHHKGWSDEATLTEPLKIGRGWRRHAH